MLDARPLATLETEVIKYDLEFTWLTHAHLEHLGADVQDDIEQRCECLLRLLCELVTLLADCLELAEDLEVVNFRSC